MLRGRGSPARRLSLGLIVCAAAAYGTVAAGSQTRYAYDAKGRLIKVEGDGPVAATSTYTYDAADNRTGVKVSAAPRVLNSSFENPVISSYVYNPTAPDLVFSGGSGISRAGDAWGFPQPWDGNQVAFLQAGGNSAGYVDVKAVNLIPGRRYQIAFAATQRPGYPANGIRVTVDGNIIWDAAPGSADRFQAYLTSAFVANQNSATIRFAATPTTYDSSSGVDAISVQTAN